TIEAHHISLDRTHRIIPPDIVLKPRRKEAHLLAAHAAFVCAIRHASNRTLGDSFTSPKFLPSLFAIPPSAAPRSAGMDDSSSRVYWGRGLAKIPVREPRSTILP